MNIKVFIEISSHSNVKYEVDEKTGQLTVDRFLHTAMVYPFNYGYVIDSQSEDNDPLDVIVLTEHQIFPGSVITCQPIGILEMEDEAGTDTKLIATPILKVDPVAGSITDINAVPAATKSKIKHFFEHYKDLEPKKWVKIKDWKSAPEAEQVVSQSLQRFTQSK